MSVRECMIWQRYLPSSSVAEAADVCVLKASALKTQNSNITVIKRGKYTILQCWESAPFDAGSRCSSRPIHQSQNLITSPFHIFKSVSKPCWCRSPWMRGSCSQSDSVVVLQESPCPQASSTTNLQVLVLVLGPQVLDNIIADRQRDRHRWSNIPPQSQWQT